MYSSATHSSFHETPVILLSLPSEAPIPLHPGTKGCVSFLSRFMLPKPLSKHLPLQAEGPQHKFLPRDLNDVCRMKGILEVILNEWLPLE